MDSTPYPRAPAPLLARIALAAALMPLGPPDSPSRRTADPAAQARIDPRHAGPEGQREHELEAMPANSSARPPRPRPSCGRRSTRSARTAASSRRADRDRARLRNARSALSAPPKAASRPLDDNERAIRKSLRERRGIARRSAGGAAAHRPPAAAGLAGAARKTRCSRCAPPSCSARCCRKCARGRGAGRRSRRARALRKEIAAETDALAPTSRRCRGAAAHDAAGRGAAARSRPRPRRRCESERERAAELARAGRQSEGSDRQAGNAISRRSARAADAAARAAARRNGERPQSRRLQRSRPLAPASPSRPPRACCRCRSTACSMRDFGASDGSAAPRRGSPSPPAPAPR